MNREETIKLLVVLNSYYDLFENKNNQQKEAIVELWNSAFANIPYQLAESAVKSYAMNDMRGFKPLPAQIKNELLKLTPLKQIDTDSAWKLAHKACRCNARDAANEFDKLPKAIQDALGGPYMLVEIAFANDDAVKFARMEFEKRLASTHEEEKKLFLSGGKTFEAIELDNSTIEEKKALHNGKRQD